jgi:hypothetical protein
MQKCHAVIIKSRHFSGFSFRTFILGNCLMLVLQVFVQAQPVISGFSPVSGAGGTMVTITGSGFNANPSLNVVRFNGVKAMVTLSSANSITCIVPPNATYGFISVSQTGLTGVSKIPFRALFNAGSNTLSHNSFKERLSIPIDGAPNFNLAADWDDDGKIDHINLDDKSFKVRVFRNTSQGQDIGLATPLIITPSVAPGWAKSADIDGDGLLDLIVFNTSASSVSVYRNTSIAGSISFANPITIGTLEAPFDGVIEDLNNDGKMDLVIVNFNASTLSVFSNSSSIGNPSFSAPVSIPVINGVIAIASGDYNGDGRVDMVVGSGRSGQYSILKNNGGFSFEATNFTNGTSWYYYGCSGDFNNDGRLDFAFTRFNFGQTTVFLNVTPTGGGFNFSPTTYNVAGSFINCSDVTGDGFPEILVDLSPVGISVLKNNQSGSPLFSPLSLNLGNLPAISVADYTNDGRPDIMGSFNPNTLKLNVNDLNPFFISGFSPTIGDRKTVITISGGDFNGVTGVKFGGIPAESFTIFSNSTIEAIPGFAASGDVEIVKGQEIVKMSGFTYQPFVYIESVNPQIGFPGAEIEIRGQYLDRAIQVGFGGVAARSFKKVSNTLIRAVVDSGSSGNVTVRDQSGVDDVFSGFTFFPSPRVDSIHPLSGPTGSVVTIFGKHLGAVSKVLFHETPGTNLTILNEGKLEIRTPDVGVGGRVKVISPYGEDSYAGFFNGPVVTSVTPASGVVKNRAVISGKGFANTLTANIVRFGSIQATVVEGNSNELIVEIPEGTPSGFISVTSFGLTCFFHNPFLTSFNGIGTGFDSTAFSMGPLISVEASNAGSRAIIGDINGDKKPDLLYRANNGSIAFSGNESITGVIKFADPLIFPSRTITNIAGIHDFDGDGLNDLIAQVPGADDSSKVFRNTGTFSRPAFSEVPHRHIQKAATVVDFDGDGRPDVVTGSFNLNKLQIYRNISGKGGIGFENPILVSWDLSLLNLVSAADLNGDGLPELIYRTTMNNIIIHRNLSVPGKIAFDFPQTFSSCSPQKVLVSDVDGNGMPDLIVSSGGCYSIYIYRNNSMPGGPIILEQPNTFNTTSAISDFGVGDLNGDLKADIMVLNTNNPSAMVLTNTSAIGSISFTPERTVSLTGPLHAFTSFEGLGISDFDGDGRADLLPRLLNNTRFIVVRNIHGSFTSGVVCPGGSLTLQAQGVGSSYQWQESLDSNSYANISNNANFNGATQSQLSIQNIPSSWSGKFIRCLVNGQPNRPVIIRVINYFTGTHDNDWNNPLNWSCGIVPDSNTEVVVIGNVTLNSNATVKNLYVQPGATVRVGAGYQLTILQ